MELAERVRRRREELGLSQEELARRMGYQSRTSINKIEMGRPVSQKIIVRLAAALDTTPVYLMGYVEENVAKKNSAIAGAVMKMRTDEQFLAAVEKLMELDPEKLKSVDQLLAAMLG